MKFAKRTIAIIITVVMLVAACVVNVSATASVTMTWKSGHNVTSGGEVTCAEYSVYGGNTGHTEKVDILQFNPSNGYIPMVFAETAGYCSRLPNHFSEAQNKYGYEVAGVINGSYFSTTDGTLVGMVISNGRIVCGHNAYNDDVVAFTPDGKMHVVNTQIEYNMTINGQEIPNAIRYINKRFDVDEWTVSQFYYYDTSCGNVADSGSTGYEIICEKVQNSDLMVGGTLFAKVVEVKKDAGPSTFESNGSIESNRFVLYCRSTSTYAPMVKNLKAGDDITITATETVEASKKIMETANSVITNVGWLVKNGVDQTDIYSTVGGLSVNAYYRSTVFGTKPDGTYVFLTSDGGSTGDSSRSLSPKEIAAAMIKLGCTNVIRMDGGGSTAMYSTNCDGKGTDGYHNYYSDNGYIRPVADSILIVKKSSAQDTKINADLKQALADAKNYLASNSNAALAAAVAEVEAALASGTVVESDARRLYAKISGKAALRDVLDDAKSISYKDYDEATLSLIRSFYDEATEAYYSTSASVSDVATLIDSLTESLNKGSYTILSKGKSYTTTALNREDAYNDDKIKLTDGAKSEKTGKDVNSYSGWSYALPKVDVTVDLGSVVNSNSYTVYGAYNYWGIKALKELKVSVSENGTDFTEVGTSTTVVSEGTGDVVEGSTVQLISLNVVTDSVQSARYIRFTVVPDGNHVWIDEVEAGFLNNASDDTVGDVIEAHGFNQFIYDSNCFIYTPDHGTLTANGINHKYTLNVILESTSDPDEWKVVSTKRNNGSAADVTLKSNQIMIACHKGNSAQSVVSDRVLATAKVGDVLVFHGINVANKTMSVAPYISIKSEQGDVTVNGKLGDINDDGKVDQYDYILAKRAHFNTVTLTSDQKTRGDVDKDGDNDQYDYILIKRHHFGTYTIG